MKSPHKRQSGGISEFCFTNAYLAMNYFTKKHAAKQPVQDHSFNNTCKV